MRKIMPFLAIICLITRLHAQNPVSWNFSSKKLDDKTFEVHVTAVISSPWHIYSQSTPADGPVATAFIFSKNPLLTLDKEIKEIGDMKKKYEDVFGVDVFYYNKKVEFIQIVRLKTKATTNLAGKLEYMVCNDEQCLPPKTIPFSVLLQ